MGNIPALIIDRDGVINHDSLEYIKSPEEWIPIEGSLQAIARISQRDIPVYIASNQSGIARGLFDYTTLHRMHKKMLVELERYGGTVNGFFFCPTLSGPCRKPQPGLLHEIQARTQIELKDCPFIGDSVKDIEAGLAAGLQPMLVRTGKGEMSINSGEIPDDIPVFDNLAAAVDHLINRMEL